MMEKYKISDNYTENLSLQVKAGRKVTNLLEKIEKNKIYYLRSYITIKVLSENNNLKALLELKSQVTQIICIYNFKTF
jgi:hypothetical protein